MRRPSSRALAAGSALAVLALSAAPSRAGRAAAPAGPPAPSPLALARIAVVERRVEVSPGAGRWQAAVEGAPLRVGEALRTGPEAVARLELPWMSLTIGPSGALRVPDANVLAVSLEAGRVVVEAPGRDALKLLTTEAEVRGRGRAVVRRAGAATAVSCLAGRFFVASAGGVVTLAAGQGTVARAGRPLAPAAPLPPRPPAEGLWPGRDPFYVTAGAPLELRWTGEAAAYSVEVLPVADDVVLLQRDAARSPIVVALPWEGAFRWRVSARDARGLEGPASDDGLVAVELTRPD